MQLPPSHIESHSVLQPLVKMVARLHVTVIANPLSKASWSQATAVQPAIFRVVKELPVILPRVGVAVLGLTLLSSFACASDYCTKEQHDRALIEDALSAGTLVRGPKSLRDSILIEEGMWFGMNYPKQIDFMQTFECAMGGAGGKELLYMDVRSLATGKLLATWTLGALKPAEDTHGPTNPGMPEANEDENRGLTGEARAAFIKSAIEECNKRSNSTASINCSCYANVMADTLSIKKTLALGNPETRMTAVMPKLKAAAERCRAN